MNKDNSDSEKKARQLQLGIYYLPIVGIIPSLWTLSRNRGDRQHQKASRLSIKLTMIWLCSYSLLFIGSHQTSELLNLRLLYTNALVTTGYFLICLVLILRLRKDK
ncbi:MAG: hypothetical protein QNJ41_09005 [Xenococcaceae cyanobacterium MO_188.B32]|nr:hypothetical protein [Xenococcaceae cyanobacterium MO_188.B32]